MKYLIGTSETIYHDLFIHIWRSFRSPACIPSAIVNTRMFYPASKVMTSIDSTSELTKLNDHVYWQIMMNVKSEGNTVCTMLQNNYGWTVGPELTITVFTPTVRGRTLHMNQDLYCQLKPWNQPARLLTREVALPRGVQDVMILNLLLPETIYRNVVSA